MEEYVNKYKRGYHQRIGDIQFIMRAKEYFGDNIETNEKIEYTEKILNSNITEIKNKITNHK